MWSDDVRALDEGTHPDSIRPAKGIHITVPWTLVRNTIAVVVPVPKDKRSVFVVPWGGAPGERARASRTSAPPTPTTTGPLDDPQCTPEDIAYVLRAINFSVADRDITEADILGTWAGLRPLVKSAASGRTADLSRGHKVRRVRQRRRHHHRRQAHHLPAHGRRHRRRRRRACSATESTGRVARRSPTKKLAPAAAPRATTSWRRRPTPAPGSLADRYGGEAAVLLAMIERDPSLGEPLVAGTDYLRAEAVYAARYEMARTLDRRAGPAHPRAAPGPRRRGRGRRRHRRAAGPGARLGRRGDRPPGRRLPGAGRPRGRRHGRARPRRRRRTLGAVAQLA